MKDRTDEMIAAPADSAGHQGSFTRPQDEMQVARPDERYGPATNQDTARAAQTRGGAFTVWLWLAVLFAAILFFVWVQFAGR